jgi:peptide/nickel transport system permease protein
VSGIVLVIAAVYVVANLLVDVAYAIVDPRLRAIRGNAA